jgi:hypothetical protein
MVWIYGGGFYSTLQCLFIPLNLKSTGGTSSIYGGDLLVKQSVARVCTSLDPDQLSTLLVLGIIHREHQSYLCP